MYLFGDQYLVFDSVLLPSSAHKKYIKSINMT